MLSACTNFIVKDLRPMYALEGDGLKDLLTTFNFLCQTYGCANLEEVSHYLPHPQTVSSNIHNLSTKIRGSIKEQLKDIFGERGPGGAISLDIWSDDYKQQSYICFIVHYIDEQFNLIKRVIANEYMSSKRKKDNQYILEKLKAMLAEFQFDVMDKIVFMSDRGSNLILALNLYNHLSCALHFICNILKQMFSGGRPQLLLKKCKKVVKFIKKSGKNEQFAPTLKAPSSVRWNYAYIMFNSLIAGGNWAKMERIIKDAGKDNLLVGLEKQEIETLAKFLELFHKATLSMESTKRPTLHRTSAYYEAFEAHLRPSGGDVPVIADAKANAEPYFLLKKEEYKDYLSSMFHKLAEFLHPALKQMRKLTAIERREVLAEVSILNFFHLL